ncbi:MAG: hypothetical protein HY329_27130 [Chloroflexi bacterium]|nr:hypothetical protein [Chloroflexota bacterium]
MSQKALREATERMADDTRFRLQVEHAASEGYAERVLREFRLTLEERAQLIELAAAEAAAPFHCHCP